MATKVKKAASKRAAKQPKATRSRASRIRTVEDHEQDGPVAAEELPAAEIVSDQEVVPGDQPAVRLTPRAVKAIKAAVGDEPSLLSAAAAVLAATGVPMRCKAIVAELARTGIWSSPSGKTPDATLAAAIVTEINKKKGESRFSKVGPGLFAASSAWLGK